MSFVSLLTQVRIFGLVVTDPKNIILPAHVISNDVMVQILTGFLSYIPSPMRDYANGPMNYMDMRLAKSLIKLHGYTGCSQPSLVHVVASVRLSEIACAG